MSGPSQLGPYKLLSRLGRGGMGDVWLAEDARLRRRVAVKLVTGPEPSGEHAQQQLLREARAAAALSHPNIAAVHDVIEADGGIAVVFEYVEGQTLAARLARGPLPAGEAIAIALDLSAALAAAHARGIVHRDLKPANIVLTREGAAKVLDFGVARVAAPDADTMAAMPTTVAGFVGTPGYAAPEQWLGQRIDARADLFSLGVVLFEMLAGRRPFGAAHPADIVRTMLQEPTPRLPRGVSAPEELRDLVARLLAIDPALRPASAREVCDVLRGLAPTRRATRPGLAPSPRRTRVAAVLAGAALMISALVASLVPGGREGVSGRAPVVAVLPLANVTSNPIDDRFAVGIADVLIANLARLPDIGVVPRAAALTYAAERDLVRAARELDADYIVDGSIQRADETLRVTLAVVSAATNLVIWSERYDAPVADVFALQRQLGEGLAAALQLRLTAAQRRGMALPPTSSEEAFARYGAGRAFLDRADVPGNIDRALREFEIAAALDPGFAAAVAGLGEAYWTEYQRTHDSAAAARARAYAEKARRLDPRDPNVAISLAVVYHGTGRSHDAVDELMRVIQVYPNNDEARRVLGTIYAESGQPARAIEELNAAVRIRPNLAAHYAALGVLHYRLGQIGESVAALRRAAELQPDNAVTHRRLGTVYQSRGQWDLALESYARANALAPDGPTYSNIGKLHYDRGDFARALEAFETAARLSPNDARIRRNLGDVYARLDRHAQAKAEYAAAVRLTEQLLAVNPNDARARAMLAVYEAKLGAFEDARAHAAAARAMAGEDAEVLYRSAVVSALGGETAQALAFLEQALARGFSPGEAQRDEDLASLHAHPGFDRIFRF